MKLEMVRGCICDSLTVDGEEEYTLSDDKREEVLDCICSRLYPKDLNRFLQWYIQEYGEYDCDDKPCECCGDYVQTWTVEL